jgi:hypothetical protein
MSAWETIRNRLVGAFGQEDGTASAIPSDAWQEFFEIGFTSPNIVVDATAATNTANTLLWSNPFSYPVQIVSAELNGAVTAANATDYATYSLYTDDAAAGTPILAGVFDTTTTNITASVDRAFTLTPTNCTVITGANIWRKVLKSGNGVAVGAHIVKLRLRRV